MSIRLLASPVNVDSIVLEVGNGCAGNASEINADYMGKCFLCDRIFYEGENSWLVFEKRIQEDGQMECSLAAILSSALGLDLKEMTAHSKLLCSNCNNVVIEFERLERNFCDIRYRILSIYNRTARRNNLDPISVEINGVLQDTDVYETDIDKKCPKEENDRHDLISENPNSIELIQESSFYSNSDLETDLVEEVNDDYEGESYLPDNPSEYAFAVIPEHDQPVVSEFTLDESELDVEGLPIDEQDIIIYDETTDQSSQSCYKDEDNSSIKPLAQEECISIHGNTFTTQDVSEQETYLVRPPRTIRGAKQLYEQHGNTTICLICDDRPQMQSKLFADHFRNFHNTRFYTCDLCNSGFLRRQNLNDHMDEHHNTKCGDEYINGIDATQFECETCHRRFTNYRLFRIHKRMHYSNAKQYDCGECHKKYSSKNLLEEHMNMHTGERPFKCIKCPKDFASKYTLQAHVKIHSERQRPFRCNQCDKAFLNQQNLTHHKKLHVGVKSFKCDVCSKAFGTQHNLDVHKIVHTGQRPFVCRTCGKSFARRAEIKDHERIHTGEKPFACDVCSLSFAQRSNLMSHKKSTHLNEKLHRCDQCDRSFKRRRLLLYHINAAHTGERPFKCDVCGAAFVYPEHQKKHMLIHAGKKPYACEVCGKGFYNSVNRNAHRFVHSDKKPYECLECGVGFMRKPMLLNHMKHTKHINDTIIINQPQIKKLQDDMLEMSSYEIKFVDAPNNTNRDELVVNDKSLENIMQHTKSILSNIENESCEDNDDSINSVSGQLIKDQIGDVKYLQFEDLDKDGHQTLTWVDIGGNNKDVVL